MKKHFSMRLLHIFSAMVFLIVFAASNTIYASDAASAEDVIKLVNDASTLLSAKGEDAFAELNDANGRWVYKDTYVFTFDCTQGTIVTHPVKPQLIGKNMMGLKDVKGNLLFVQMCEAAKRGKNEWVEYWWPKPGEKKMYRKISLLINVPGTAYQVGAGIYDENASVEDLNRLSK